MVEFVKAVQYVVSDESSGVPSLKERWCYSTRLHYYHLSKAVSLLCCLNATVYFFQDSAFWDLPAKYLEDEDILALHALKLTDMAIVMLWLLLIVERERRLKPGRSVNCARQNQAQLQGPNGNPKTIRPPS
ncbi:hypothetical protein NEUTE1DRAFT_101763 [Neurospora tetrasperma FGSC 2508]|uniref:Uncharacterized protein n=1 Tax=Neurospora tetrasperma (strain FGSC 2508 / ATCC MYA-4615 / P0657) TaxID=510951 RepID=F8MQ54_NEUT8|nr:uncharacterized protein NEUTE1DRAFT_101763 [Neurospora tetrasperma FGSC 2508]EGO56484.1 hypothetical protein NEUTE1DRAFT_101763 [Neurospora tetrasperma FGSC 2508]